VPELTVIFKNFLLTAEKKYGQLVGTYSAEWYSMMETTGMHQGRATKSCLVFHLDLIHNSLVEPHIALKALISVFISHCLLRFSLTLAPVQETLFVGRSRRISNVSEGRNH
jgi:hypothetical protein